MTTFTNCAATDQLRQHDTYRLTIVPGGHLLAFLEPDSVKSAELMYGLEGIFAVGGIENVTPLFGNPYVSGDLAAVVDFLVMSDGNTVADMIDAVTAAGNDPALAAVDIQTCEQVVGAKSVASGTSAADNAVYSANATGARTSEAAAAASAIATGGSNNWLGNLESQVGKVGTVALYAGAALAAYWLYQQAKRVKRIAS